MADNALNRVITGAFSSTGAMAYSYANKAYNDWRERAELSEIQTSQNEQIPQQGVEGADLPVISEQTDALEVSNQQEVIELDEAGVEDVREKRFQDLLEKADTSDIIEFDDELEDIVGG